MAPVMNSHDTMVVMIGFFVLIAVIVVMFVYMMIRSSDF